MYHGPRRFKFIMNGSDHMRLRQSGYLEGKKKWEKRKDKRPLHPHLLLSDTWEKYISKILLNSLTWSPSSWKSKYTLIQYYKSPPFPTLPFLGYKYSTTSLLCAGLNNWKQYFFIKLKKKIQTQDFKPTKGPNNLNIPNY